MNVTIAEHADAIIRAALQSQKASNESGHEFQPSYNQPLGYHVLGMSYAITGGYMDVPYASWVERSNDAPAIRRYLIENLKDAA